MEPIIDQTQSQPHSEKGELGELALDDANIPKLMEQGGSGEQRAKHRPRQEADAAQRRDGRVTLPAHI